MSTDSILPVQSNTSALPSSDQGSSAIDTRQIMQSFNDMLRLAMLAQLMFSLSSSNSSDGSDSGSGSSMGSFGAGSMMASMMSLYEQMLSKQIQSVNSVSTTAATGLASLAKTVSCGVASSLHHINQFLAELQIGGDGANADCGPASLAMALHQLGLGVAGETAGNNDGQVVDLCRRSMAASSAKDGVDANGKRVDAEHSTFTDFSDLARGAAAAGAKGQMITASAASIQSALQSGASVVASGTFAGKYPLPWTGDRGFDNTTAPGHATAHLIQISSYDPATNTFLINDPARSQANRISASALEQFMAGNAGAIALRK